MSTDVRPSSPTIGGPFRLTDHYGARVSDQNYPGRYLLLFFGFTRCRSICPRALGKLSGALDSLGECAASVQGLYVTVDPERDTPDALRTFLKPWPRFIGLTGSAAEIESTRAAYRVFAVRRQAPGGDYRMPHSALSHLVGPCRAHLDHWPESLAELEIAERLRRSLEGLASRLTVEASGPQTTENEPARVQRSFGSLLTQSPQRS